MKAKLTWTDPTTRVNGSPLAPSEIAEVNVYMLLDGSGTAQKLGSVGAGVQTFTSEDQPPGSEHDYYVNVTDTGGRIGDNSPAVRLAIPAELEKPSAVSNLTVELAP